MKLVLTSKQLLEKIFPEAIHGYNPLDVDEFIDLIINDYKEVEKNHLLTKSEMTRLNGRLEKLRVENENLLIENKSLKKRLDGIKSSDTPNKDNIELIKRINKLEGFLWKHGFSPEDIK